MRGGDIYVYVISEYEEGSVSQSVSQSVSWSVNWSVCQSVRHLAAVAVGGCLFSHPMHATEFALAVSHDLQGVAASTACKGKACGVTSVLGLGR